MTDRKDGPSKGPDRAATEPGGARRPFATIDLKATEVKPEAAKDAQPSQAAAAARVAAAAAAASAAHAASAAGTAAAAKPADRKADDRLTGSVPRAGDNRSEQPPDGKATGGERPADGKAAAAADDAHPIAAASAASRQGSGVGRFLSHMAAGVVGGGLALVGAPTLAPMLGLEHLVGLHQAANPASSPEFVGRLTALERSMRERLAQPAVDAGAHQRQQQALDAAVQKVDELGRTVAGLREAQTRLSADTLSAITDLRTAQRPASDPGERLTKLEEQYNQMAAVAAANPQQAGRLPQLAQLTGKVADLETQLATRLDRLQKDVRQEVENRVGAAADASEAAKAGTQRLDREVAAVKSDASRLGQRIDDVRSGSERIDQSVKGLQSAAEQLKAALAGFQGEVEKEMKTVARPADIARALTPVADRVAAIEGGMQGIVRAEEDRRSNAERIVLSLELGNLKRAMERGARYEAELAEVRRIAGSRLDLAALERHKATGVPTAAELARTFRPVANAVLDVEATPENAGVVDKLVTGAKGMVRIRKTTHGPDDNSAEAVLARMETALKDGRLGDVVAEAKKLTPRLAAPAKGWLEKVEARQTVDAALVGIDKALKSSLGGGPAQGGTR